MTYPIIVTDAPEQMEAGILAVARLIADHIQQGLENGTWIIVGGKAIPRVMLHFYQNDGIMETCEQTAP